MVVELPAVVELLAGLQFLSRVQLRLVDAQVPVRVGGTGLAVGNGEIPIQNGSNRRDSLVDGSRPAHTGPVLNEPFPIVGEGHPAAFVKPGMRP